jgi:seryl-tRNA(Sec) selenium transferase
MTAISKVKQTLATLKGAEATLRMYSLQDQDKKSRAAYNQTSEEIRKISTDLEKRIGTMEFEEPQYKGN